MGLHVFPIPIPPPTHKLFCASASWHMLCYPLSPSRSAILYSTSFWPQLKRVSLRQAYLSPDWLSIFCISFSVLITATCKLAVVWLITYWVIPQGPLHKFVETLDCQHVSLFLPPNLLIIACDEP